MIIISIFQPSSAKMEKNINVKCEINDAIAGFVRLEDSIASDAKRQFPGDSKRNAGGGRGRIWKKEAKVFVR